VLLIAIAASCLRMISVSRLLVQVLEDEVVETDEDFFVDLTLVEGFPVQFAKKSVCMNAGAVSHISLSETTYTDLKYGY
jgi:hypothetical protein